MNTYSLGETIVKEHFLWKVEYKFPTDRDSLFVHITTEEFSHAAAVKKWDDKYNCTVDISYAGPVLV